MSLDAVTSEELAKEARTIKEMMLVTVGRIRVEEFANALDISMAEAFEEAIWRAVTCSFRSLVEARCKVEESLSRVVRLHNAAREQDPVCS